MQTPSSRNFLVNIDWTSKIRLAITKDFTKEVQINLFMTSMPCDRQRKRPKIMVLYLGKKCTYQKLSTTWGIIHLKRTQNFPKNEHFLPFDAQTYFFVTEKLENFVYILNEFTLVLVLYFHWCVWLCSMNFVIQCHRKGRGEGAKTFEKRLKPKLISSKKLEKINPLTSGCPIKCHPWLNKSATFDYRFI